MACYDSIWQTHERVFTDDRKEFFRALLHELASTPTVARIYREIAQADIGEKTKEELTELLTTKEVLPPGARRLEMRIHVELFLVE